MFAALPSLLLRRTSRLNTKPANLMTSKTTTLATALGPLTAALVNLRNFR